MSCLKKIVALVLAVSIILTSFSVDILAASNDYTQWRQGDAEWNKTEAWSLSQYPSSELHYMSEAGCLVTSIAMLLRHYNVITDSNVNSFNPWICNEKLKAAGAFDGAADLKWGMEKVAFPGFVYEGVAQYSLAKITELYNQGYACVVKVNGSNGYDHYVAVKEVSGNTVKIMDPGAGYTLLSNYGFQYEIRYYSVTPASMGSIPVGSYDTAEGGESSIHVTGWAYDPDTLEQSVTIHVYVDGTKMPNEYRANIERNDVNTAYGCGAYHGFDIEIPYSVATTGEHTVEVYALNTTYGESAKHLGAKTVTIKADTIAPTITDVEIMDLTKNGFTIQCNVSDNAEVSEVKIAVWPHPDGSWNHVWHTATVSDGVATCYIDVNETHGGIVDYKYAAHIYAYDAAGNETKVGTPWIYVDATPPVISNVIVEEDSEGYTIICDVSDNGEVDYVQFPTWTTLNGQDDLVGNDGSWAYLEFYRGTYADGKATFRVNKSEHNNETGQYQTDIYAHDKCNNESKYTLKYTIEDKVEEPPHSHLYTSKVTKEATCTEKGVKTYTCECKDSYTEEIPVKGHSYEGGSCIRCGAKDPDYVPETEVDPTSPQIIVESVTASAGETVDVKISLKNNPGIASMKLKVAYDSKLTLESVTYNNQLGGQSQQPQSMSNPVTLNWFNGSVNSTGDKEYAILKFTVSDDAKGGTKANISITYNSDDVYNIAEENIKFTVVNGAIEVISYIPGDINGDKEVNNKDVTRLFQYLSDWDVEVVEEALDVNGDGSINNKDLTRLFQYLSDWDVEIY